MLSRRHDQENLAARHHEAAAIKPLNQPSSLQPKPSAFAPKTPGRKFALNDENQPGLVGRKTSKPSKNDNAQFVTPAAQKTRPALGAKTTNIKARAFTTLLQDGKTDTKTGRTQVARAVEPAVPPAQQSLTTGFPTKKQLVVLQDARIEPTLSLDDGDLSDWDIESCPPLIEPLCDDPVGVFPPNFDYSTLTNAMLSDKEVDALLGEIGQDIEREGSEEQWDFEGFVKRLEGEIETKKRPQIGVIGDGRRGGNAVSSRLTQATTASAAKSVQKGGPPAALQPSGSGLLQIARKPGEGRLDARRGVARRPDGKSEKLSVLRD